MKAIISFIISLVFLSVPLSAYAHDGEATIDLNVTQASPGASIEIHGSGFEENDIATIMLMPVGSDRLQTLGTATADDKGNLAQTVVLPADLVSGAYEVRVADVHHQATAELSIVTKASDEEGEQRGEEEPLLAPMPQPATNTSPINSADSSNPALPSTAVPATQAAASASPVLLLSSGLVLTALVVGAVLFVRWAR